MQWMPGLLLAVGNHKGYNSSKSLAGLDYAPTHDMRMDANGQVYLVESGHALT